MGGILGGSFGNELNRFARNDKSRLRVVLRFPWIACSPIVVFSQQAASFHFKTRQASRRDGADLGTEQQFRADGMFDALGQGIAGNAGMRLNLDAQHRQRRCAINLHAILRNFWEAM
jgi:hypothetical protein